ncbi:hypothetical protein EDB92DRAFT_2051115 [Lactarius akahatsu]|uniref:Uncharacterized protein n=1 Tax=Lactarius akahatsu TaxID=416441 RepID=A0AAD4LUQ6_9AGAM|nr:hypothetical protein EDB92DRAFT_2051115 [Lactarius akahatsu]
MWRHGVARCSSRTFSTLDSSLPTSHRVPWFVDPQETLHTQRAPPQTATSPAIPPGAPPALQNLYTQLRQSPYLEPSALLVRDPINRPPGPPLPVTIPKGRRKRGRTYAGEGFLEPGGIWNWILLAQVKEGTEKRGAIAATVRLVRKTLSSTEPPLQLPKKTRTDNYDGWAMVDAGEFAVHVLSAKARERYFTEGSRW